MMEEPQQREDERNMFLSECWNAPTVSTPPPFVQEMLPVKDYLKVKNTTIVSYVSIGGRTCIKLTEIGVRVIKGLIFQIVDEINLTTNRSNIEEEDVLVNDHKVELKNDPRLTTPNAADSGRNMFLRKVISLIYNLCGESRRLIPLDLKHLLDYFSKVEGIREHRDFILHHPALWNAVCVERMILSLDITSSIKDPREGPSPINNALARIKFLWQVDFENLVIKNTRLNQEHFYAAIKRIWINTKSGSKCGDDIKGFLHFMRNIFTHVHEELARVPIRGGTALSHQAKAVWDFMHVLKPDFLYLLYTNIFYIVEFQPYFIPLM